MFVSSSVPSQPIYVHQTASRPITTNANLWKIAMVLVGLFAAGVNANTFKTTAAVNGPSFKTRESDKFAIPCNTGNPSIADSFFNDLDLQKFSLENSQGDYGINKVSTCTWIDWAFKGNTFELEIDLIVPSEKGFFTEHDDNIKEYQSQMSKVEATLNQHFKMLQTTIAQPCYTIHVSKELEKEGQRYDANGMNFQTISVYRRRFQFLVRW